MVDLDGADAFQHALNRLGMAVAADGEADQYILFFVGPMENCQLVGRYDDLVDVAVGAFNYLADLQYDGRIMKRRMIRAMREAFETLVCNICGERCVPTDPSWRCTGTLWQHRCDSAQGLGCHPGLGVKRTVTEGDSNVGKQ